MGSARRIYIRKIINIRVTEVHHIEEVIKMGGLAVIVGIVVFLCGLAIMGGSVFFTPLNHLIGIYGGMTVGGIIAVIGVLIAIFG